MMNEKNLVKAESPQPLAIQRELSVDDVVKQVDKVRELMSRVMKPDVDYGVIPGTSGKPSLFKPGAELLGKLFKLRPEYEVTWAHPNDHPGHIEVYVKCRLYHIETGMPMGEGVGSCSSLESKYRWRTTERKCPSCSTEAIIKGKQEYGGGWLCFKKKGGCGAKFADNAPEIITQPRGKGENPDIADIHNTVVKIAAKRAKIDATLTATAASSLFTQDIEDIMNGGSPNGEEKAKKGSEPAGSAEKLTDSQKTKLWATANDLARLKGEAVKDMMQDIYKRLKIDVHSSTELTKSQASQVIDYLMNEAAP